MEPEKKATTKLSLNRIETSQWV